MVFNRDKTDASVCVLGESVSGSEVLLPTQGVMDDALVYLDKERYVGEKVKEVHQSSFLTVKLSQNLEKYQQQSSH